jgi:hypothetical protein
MHRANLPMAVLFTSQQGGATGGAIEAWQAEPVNGPVSSHQGCGAAIRCHRIMSCGSCDTGSSAENEIPLRLTMSDQRGRDGKTDPLGIASRRSFAELDDGKIRKQMQGLSESRAAFDRPRAIPVAVPRPPTCARSPSHAAHVSAFLSAGTRRHAHAAAAVPLGSARSLDRQCRNWPVDRWPENCLQPPRRADVLPWLVLNYVLA